MTPTTPAAVRRKHWRWLFLPIATLAFYYYLWLWNPLPSDEAMIENFSEHRADFVEAVRRYREYPRPPDKDTSLWYKDGDTLELYKRAGIDGIDYSTPMWLANPYSVETARKAESMIGYAFSQKYGSLRIRPATTPRIDHPDLMDDSGYRRNTLLFGVIWKDYYFFPEVPRIENGKLLGPFQIVGKNRPNSQYHEREGISTWQFQSRAFPSLNRLPRHWENVECVYRQIESQWFLRLCNGRH